MNKAFLSVAEAAIYLGVSEKAIRKWVAERRLDAFHLGRLVRLRLSDIEEFALSGLIPKVSR